MSYFKIMTLKTTKTHTERRIDVASFREVRNVAASLKVSEIQLKAAVAAVGPLLEDVRKYLNAYNTPLLHRPKRGLRH